MFEIIRAGQGSDVIDLSGDRGITDVSCVDGIDSYFVDAGDYADPNTDEYRCQKVTIVAWWGWILIQIRPPRISLSQGCRRGVPSAEFALWRVHRSKLRAGELVQTLSKLEPLRVFA